MGDDGLDWRGVDPAWAAALASEDFERIESFLAAESRAGRHYLPAPENVLRAFRLPLAKVRVLIIGQDPYPNPKYPVGLPFSVERSVRPIPQSLRNIYRELNDDLAIPVAKHGDLSRWSENGVMLLNRVLTVQAGVSGSHRRRGWEAVTEAAVRSLVARGGPLVSILWGRDAASLTPILGATPIVASAHPSPLSARNGFFGSRPFSRANHLLVQQGGTPIDWTLG